MKLKDLKVIDNNIDLDKYIEFREYVKKHMEHPEWLGDFTKEELEIMLKTNSKIWIYYLNLVSLYIQSVLFQKIIIIL